MSFKNKVVVITGGSSGIGAATAILFAKEEANVVIVGRNESKLNKVVTEISKQGKEPLVIKIDIIEKDAPKIIIDKTVEAYGGIDVLINNAGIIRDTDIFEENFLEKYDMIINTNLRAAVAIINQASSHIIKSAGNIINISSVMGKTLLSNHLYMAYCTAKAGLDHFTRSAALAFAKYNVRVNIVSPGATRTDLLDTDDTKADWDVFGLHTPLRKVVEPEEVAELIMFVASDKAKSITGSDYVIDNGDLLIK